MELLNLPAHAALDDAAGEAPMRVVARLSSVLKVLGRAGRHGATFTDVCREAEMGKSTTHRLLAALVDAGLAYQDLVSKRYKLGSAMALLGASAIAQSYASACQPALDTLAETSGDTAYATVLEGSSAVCIARAIGAFPIRTVVMNVGDRRPLGVGAGSLALLSALDDAAVAQVLKRNVRWLKSFHHISPEEIPSMVATTRERGFAFMSGQIVPGMCAVGYALLDQRGRPTCALSIAAIKDRMGEDRVMLLAELLKQQAFEMSGSIAALQAEMA